MPELYLDLDTVNHPSTDYDDSSIQLRFNRGLDYPSASGRADQADYIYHYEEKAGNVGWIIELAIPWTSALPTGALPEDINSYVNTAMGFDVLAADSDNEDGDITVGNRDAHAAWDEDGLNGTEDLAWNTTSVFGIVELLLEPLPPAIPYTQPIRTLEIPARQDKIVFDGNDNESSWSDAQDVALFSTGGYSGVSDFDASFKLTWDMEYIYFFADITDDIDHSYSAGLDEVWMFDCIEFFLDLDTVMGSTDYDLNTIQLRFNRGLDEPQITGRATNTEFEYYWENKPGDDGWIVEIAIPWTCAMPEGSLPEDFLAYVNKFIGFDVNFTDSDNSDGDPDVGNRDVQSAWDADGLDGTEDLAWNNTHVFGIVELIGQPAPPEPDPVGLPFIEPVKVLDIPVMNTEFIPDAVNSETFWSYPQHLTVFNSNEYSGEDDLGAYFRTAWDYDYLYLYAYITDDINQSWNIDLDDAWNYDNLELYLDLDTLSMETGYRDNSTIMIRFNRGVDFIQSTGRASEEDFIYSAQNFASGTGWKFEAGIPWTSVLAAGSYPSDIQNFLPAIGFDIIVNDLDAETLSGRNAITQAAWDTEFIEVGVEPLEDEAMINTRMFGIANLSPYGLNPIESNEDKDLHIYPNPANDQLFLKGAADITHIGIIHVSGQVVMEINEHTITSIDISGLPAGVYFIRYKMKDGDFGSSLFLKH